MTKTFFLLLLLSSVLPALAQQRLRPGVLYPEGSAITAPQSGLSGVVPQGWFGTLPQGEDIFLLLPNSSEEAYMLVRTREAALDKVEAEWQQTFDVTDNISARQTGASVRSDNRLSANFSVDGTRKPAKGHATAIDGGHGKTAIFILIAPEASYDKYYQQYQQLMSSVRMEAPSLASAFADFDWSQFLVDKYITSRISDPAVVKKDHLWLCADGSFKSKVQRGGFLHTEKSKYQGKKRGRWHARGIGEAGQLVLTFDKADPLTLDLEIKDKKIYVNGTHMYLMENPKCP
jgi:hypothetical protein